MSRCWYCILGNSDVEADYDREVGIATGINGRAGSAVWALCVNLIGIRSPLNRPWFAKIPSHFDTPHCHHPRQVSATERLSRPGVWLSMDETRAKEMPEACKAETLYFCNGRRRQDALERVFFPSS